METIHTTVAKQLLLPEQNVNLAYAPPRHRTVRWYSVMRKGLTRHLCGHLEAAPIWEVIVEGRFCIWSMLSKEEALKEISTLWPNSLGLLTHSMNCYGVGSHDGQCFPGLVASEQGVSLNHYLRMLDSKEPDFIEKPARLPTENPKFFAGHPDPNKMHLPDLTGYSKSICPRDDAAFVNLVALLSTLRNMP